MIRYASNLDGRNEGQRRRALGAAWAVVLLLAATSLAQKRVYSGNTLHNNLQQYTLRGDMGHKLDNNLAVNSSGFNTSGAAIQGNAYQARRLSNYSPTVQQAARNQQQENYAQGAHAANLARSQYSPPMYSEAYRDALARTGRNPNVNPYGNPNVNPFTGQ